MASVPDIILRKGSTETITLPFTDDPPLDAPAYAQPTPHDLEADGWDEVRFQIRTHVAADTPLVDLNQDSDGSTSLTLGASSVTIVLDSKITAGFPGERLVWDLEFSKPGDDVEDPRIVWAPFDVSAFVLAPQVTR